MGNTNIGDGVDSKKRGWSPTVIRQASDRVEKGSPSRNVFDLVDIEDDGEYELRDHRPVVYPE
jgi:hypothetical protein